MNLFEYLDGCGFWKMVGNVALVGAMAFGLGCPRIVQIVNSRREKTKVVDKREEIV